MPEPSSRGVAVPRRQLSRSVLVDADVIRAAVPELRPGDERYDAELGARFAEHFPRLHGLFRELYGERADSLASLAAVVDLAVTTWRERPEALKALDRARTAQPAWFQSNRMLAGVCYVDRYAGSLDGIRRRIPYFRELGLTVLHLMPLFASPEGNDDGGYAVSSYRDVDPALGTMPELASLARELRDAGISLELDFIFNHTSNEHEWARRAVAGEVVDGVAYEDFYLIFPDRTMPDAYERTTREIFPDDHPGSFVQLPDGRWIWATFYHFQWDLNYANPEVFRAMAGEMTFLANQGVEILRMDAVAFIWKQLGTPCESLPQVHLLLQAFNALLAIATPGVVLKSEAIVHPDEVVSYVSVDECQLSYNPLQMALTWEALATRDASLLNQALERRHGLPEGTAWVNYVRSHDDIGWTFADEDAAELGIDGFEHRRFLNRFFVGREPGSFARGVPFQDNPRTGDCRITGTTAALTGIEAGDPGGVDRAVLAYSLALSTGGVPLLYLGDEVAQPNDPTYVSRPEEADDSRWVHRPFYPEQSYAAREDTATPSGAVFAALTRLLTVRRRTPELGGGRLWPFHTGLRSVVAFQRPGWTDDLPRVVVLANVGDDAVHVPAERFAGFDRVAHELVGGVDLDLRGGVSLPAHGIVWLHATPR
ncbi:amylosucrase [Salana multivorans]|uniref:Amylosucrase n=1 Tax=Salana multivorans TaxID=120377 RepID=A0A3N2D8R0_9MICO|nr:alpha-amylase family protein [Salana multivorans]ROR96171.1 amylosucrase [Salana multivorans]